MAEAALVGAGARPVRGGGSAIAKALSDADTLERISLEANKGSAMFGRGEYEWGDRTAMAEVQALAGALRRGDAQAASVVSRMEELSQLDLSAPALELIDRLRDLAEFTGAIEIKIEETGGQELQDLMDELRNFHMPDISSEYRDQVNSIIAVLLDGELSAKDAKAALRDVASDNPNVNAYLSALNILIDGFDRLRAAADTAAAAARAAAGAGLSENQIAGYQQYASSRLQGVANGIYVGSGKKDWLIEENIIVPIFGQSLPRIRLAKFDNQPNWNNGGVTVRRNIVPEVMKETPEATVLPDNFTFKWEVTGLFAGINGADGSSGAEPEDYRLAPGSRVSTNLVDGWLEDTIGMLRATLDDVARS